MKIIAILAALLTVPTVANANCQDDLKDFKKAERFGAYNFTCEDHYDGRATSSWRMSNEDFKRYREALKQSKKRRKS